MPWSTLGAKVSITLEDLLRGDITGIVEQRLITQNRQQIVGNLIRSQQESVSGVPVELTSHICSLYSMSVVTTSIARK